MKINIKTWNIILYYCILTIILTTTIKINDKVLFCGEDYIGSPISLLFLALPTLIILIKLIINFHVTRKNY